MKFLKVLWLIALFLLSSLTSAVLAQAVAERVTGVVLDPAGALVPGVRIQADGPRGLRARAVSGADGRFVLLLPASGRYTIRAEATGLRTIARSVQANADTASLILRFERLTAMERQVVVQADVSQIDMAEPDPSQKVMVREELLDANPGRPGAPISIPGLPIETASGGIKAPQYFAPGVAGDHGEPIAQYIAVGRFLVPNNLSANAHGNGYADPNIYVSAALGSVATDGGAYNVLEGNHALNLSATYSVRPLLHRFVTLTSDYRDIDATVGFASPDPLNKEWLALEANYGNGLMLTLEHRQQYKFNGWRVYDAGDHAITLFTDGYYGHSHEGNLVPVGCGVQVRDTVDPRQMDQTHTFLLAANGQWKATSRDELNVSGFFRTYNLALFSDFGEGLIRQSEFRTVEGAEVRETRRVTPWLEAMVGGLYNEDDIHNDDLDHYLSDSSLIDGPFVKVLSNDVTIRELAPYAALHAEAGPHIHAYAGLRSDVVAFVNTDKMKVVDSFRERKIFENPKATLSWSPGHGPYRWLPSASFSIGQAFFTEDPRIRVGSSIAGSGGAAFANPLERSHALQLAVEKVFGATDLRLTLSRTTTTATLAKIDPDNGSADDLGPSTIKFLTANVRRQFNFGSAQVTLSKADARLASFNGAPGMVVPEAPRTIFDLLAIVDRLPFGLHARAEYEYVGHKFLDVGNAIHPEPYEAIPVGETRLAAVRSFLDQRLELGLDGLIARGYTGQTTETFDPAWSVATAGTSLPYCAAGSGPSGLSNDFDCGTTERAVGIRMVSWIGGSVSWRFGTSR